MPVCERGCTQQKPSGFPLGAKEQSKGCPLIKGNWLIGPHWTLQTRPFQGGNGVLALVILAADPGHEYPEGADQGHDQRWEVEDLVDEDADRW